MKSLGFCVTLLLAANASAADWQVDAAKSSLSFKGSYQNEAFDGTFKRFDAAISYDAATPSTSKFDVSIDLASADTGNGERDDALHGNDFFDVKKSPMAHFVTESFAKSADGAVTANGTLTIREKTVPITLKVVFAEAGAGATLDVATTLKRADFGLGAGSDWADVGAEVPVHGHLVLTAK